MAFKRRMTVLELFVSTIMKCYFHLMKAGQIPMISETELDRHYLAFQKLTTRSAKGHIVTIFEYNLVHQTPLDQIWLQRNIDEVKKKMKFTSKFDKGRTGIAK